jgi:hypothetical protein
MKARSRELAKKFKDLPNVGPRVAKDYEVLGFKEPKDLIGRDPFDLYKKLIFITKKYQDPCLLDVFMSVTDFMNGASPRPWWHYTLERKIKYPNISRKKLA